MGISEIRIVCRGLVALIAASAVPVSGQVPDADLRNMTIGELLGRDAPAAPAEPETAPVPADVRCDRFPFRDNGADLSGFVTDRPASPISAKERQILVEDFQVQLNVRGEAAMFAEPAVALESSADTVAAAGAAFGVSSSQFAEAAHFHGEMLIDTFDYVDARNHLGAALYFGCRTDGVDTRLSISRLDAFAYVAGLTGDTLTGARLLNDLADRLYASRGQDHPDTIAVRERHALALADLNRRDQAEALLRSTHILARKSFASDDIGLINSINNYAFILGTNGKLDEAIGLHSEVVEKNRAHFETGHPRQIAGIGNLAIALLKAGRTEEAAPLLADEMRLVQSADRVSDYDLAVALLNRADLAIAQERVEDARLDQKRAVGIYQKIYGDDHPVTRRAREKLWRSLLQLEDPEALTLAKTAVTHAGNRSRALGFRIGSKLLSERNLASESEVQTLYLDSLWIAGKRDALSLGNRAFPALQIALQTPVNRAFGAAAARRMAMARSARLGELVTRREALSRLWETAENERIMLLSRSAANSGEALSQRTGYQQTLADQMAAIDTQLRSQAPDFFDLLRPAPVTAKTAGRILGPQEAVLMVQPGAFGTHIMLVDKKGVHWHRSSWSRDQIDAAVQRLLFDAGLSFEVSQETLDGWEDKGRAYKSYDRQLAHDLYLELIAPFAGELADVSQIFVVAGGSLSSLPFGLLVSERPERGDEASAKVLRQTRWMIDEFALATLPSLQSLSQTRTGQSRGRHAGADTSLRARFVGFGAPQLNGQGIGRSIGPSGRSGAAFNSRSFFSMDPQSGNRSVQLEKVRNLSRLPGTAAELKTLSAVLGGGDDALYLGDRATEPEFRAAKLDAEIMVLATHGLIAGELDFLTEPALVFTPPQAYSPEDDGLLMASEISRLRIGAEWVVLSACNSASSDGREGAPGLSGLARAFFYAGARNLLVSHWPVRDDVAARITVRAIELEKSGEFPSRANALRVAIQELRADTSLDKSDDHLAHPNAWAPFVLVGDSRR